MALIYVVEDDQNICEIETIELVKAGKNGLDFSASASFLIKSQRRA